jgi:hypothetical protein
MGRRRSWLRELGRRRAQRVVIVLALPALLVVLTDVVLRGGRLLDLPFRYFGSYGVAIVESAALWGTLLTCASARRGWFRWVAAGLFVVLATAAVGGQVYFHGQYATYLNLDATLFGASMGDSLAGQLTADGPHFLASSLPPLVVSLVLVWLGRRLIRTRRRTASWVAMAVPVALTGALFIPCSYRSIQGSTPDVIYFHAIGGLLKRLSGVDETKHVRPKRRTPPSLGPVAGEPPIRRNVLVVLSEAIRFDVSCSDHRAQCPVMPFTNEAVPDRLPLLELRSSSSATAIEIAVLWTGLGPDAGRERLHQAPSLFDYAHAAGWDTAYWSSHHQLFANTWLYVQDLPCRFLVGATNLDPSADVDLGADDRLLTERVKADLVQLSEPFFAMAHYGNTHVPYLIDEGDAPFKPHLASKAPADNEAFHNTYRNAVYHQDRTVADLVRFVRSLPLSERTIILYTSDHGEQFREHGQLGHTGSVFDVEIHVPGWIDAPSGSLTEPERAALKSYARAPTSHTDLPPTLLDMMGLWGAPELADHQQAMVGGSLLRPGRPDRVLSLANCSGVWGCAFENWGVMHGWRKLHAREWDRDWLCYDVQQDPGELSALPLESCADLVEVAVQRFKGLPGRR